MDALYTRQQLHLWQAVLDAFFGPSFERGVTFILASSGTFHGCAFVTIYDLPNSTARKYRPHSMHHGFPFLRLTLARHHGQATIFRR